MKIKYTTRFFNTRLLFLICLMSLICAGKSVAQTTAVTIKVTNKQAQPVVYATVKVVSLNDSIYYFEKVTDSSGIAAFDLVQSQRYKITVTSVDHSPVEKGISIKNHPAYFTFLLENATKTLDAVVVQSKKPLMRQEDDKTIVDPENLAASSTSGYEVLEKNPGPIYGPGWEHLSEQHDPGYHIY